jgi:hypothetical protein
LYAAPTLLCCVGEYFGDAGAITLAGSRLARLRVNATIVVLDLRGTAATGAGTIPAIGAITPRAVTQAWARWWYEHPQLSSADGVLFSSSHSGEDSLALWERARGKLECPRGQHWPLESPSLADEIQVAADRLRLPVT